MNKNYQIKYMIKYCLDGYYRVYKELYNERGSYVDEVGDNYKTMKEAEEYIESI